MNGKTYPLVIMFNMLFEHVCLPVSSERTEPTFRGGFRRDADFCKICVQFL